MALEELVRKIFWESAQKKPKTHINQSEMCILLWQNDGSGQFESK